MNYKVVEHHNKNVSVEENGTYVGSQGHDEIPIVGLIHHVVAFGRSLHTEPVDILSALGTKSILF